MKWLYMYLIHNLDNDNQWGAQSDYGGFVAVLLVLTTVLCRSELGTLYWIGYSESNATKGGGEGTLPSSLECWTTTMTTETFSPTPANHRTFLGWYMEQNNTGMWHFGDNILILDLCTRLLSKSINATQLTNLIKELVELYILLWINWELSHIGTIL